MADESAATGRDPVSNRPQLLTYPDSLGGTLAELIALLRGPLDGLFGGVHVLPPYPSTGDRGFAPITYDRIDPRFGTWADIEDLARTHEVVLDVMVNHISRRSPEFEAFSREGPTSLAADLFITPEKIWPAGPPPADDLARLFLRRRSGPFSTFIAGDGSEVTIWTTFGDDGMSEQIDLDLRTSAARELIERTLSGLASHAVSTVRLDAVGYVVKKPGTSSFMVEPEIYDFLDWVTDVAGSFGMAVLPEIHDRYSTHQALAARGHWTYDFVLPALLLYALETHDTGRLVSHLMQSPAKQVTVLDCHDGIPIQPDLTGVLTVDELRWLTNLVEQRGGNVNRILSPSHAQDGLDVHQLNCTYYSAVGADDDAYLTARAIQLFARGVPQIYYVGLLAGGNDYAAVAATGEGRAINRHDFAVDEFESSMRRPVVERTLDLIRLRNSHPAFGGALAVSTDVGGALVMTWRKGDAWCELRADLAAREVTISSRQPGEDARTTAIASPHGGSIHRSSVS